MRRTLLAAACAALAVLPALPRPAAAQTLHIALREDADILDPTLSSTYVGRIVFAGLCDKLFDIDEKLQIVPMLATGYEWADSKTLVIHLRPNVLFQDGEKLDAAAVKYTLERYLTMPGSFRKSEINSIDHVEVADPLTVRIVLKQPSSPFLSQLADRAGMILAPQAAEKEGKDFGLHPVCAGPFSFVERVPQDRIVLQRFKDYWGAKDIHFDRVIYQPIVDSSVRLANLKAGAVDLVEYIVPTDAAAVKADPKLRLVVSDNLGYQGITINTAHGPRADTPLGQNKLVRQAFELSIDRAALIQVVYNGMYTPTAQAVPSASPFYIKSIQPPPRDVAKAKTLLQQAGVKPPITVTLMTPNSPDVLQTAQVIQSMAAEAGFEREGAVHRICNFFAGILSGQFPGVSDRLVRPRRYGRQYLRLPAQQSTQQRRQLFQRSRGPDAGPGPHHHRHPPTRYSVREDVEPGTAGPAVDLSLDAEKHRRDDGKAERVPPGARWHDPRAGAGAAAMTPSPGAQARADLSRQAGEVSSKLA